MPFAMRQCVVQEYRLASIAIVFVSVPVLFFLVAFVLPQEGVRRALRWPNTSRAHLTVWSLLHFRASRLLATFRRKYNGSQQVFMDFLFVVRC